MNFSSNVPSTTLNNSTFREAQSMTKSKKDRLQTSEIIPKPVGDYLLGMMLGEGSYGKVKEAICMKDKSKRFAIKVIKKRNLKKIPEGEKSILREIEIMRKLNHKNCVKLYHFFTNEQNEKMFIVMEYIGGGSVLDLIEKAPKKRIPLCQVQNLFSQLLDALEYVHSIGIIHRDVKPNNLLIALDGTLKLSDFGVAHVMDSKEPMRGNGSPVVQPPEIASGKDVFSGPKIDVWAAGITLYYMVVGDFPFKAQNVYSLFQTIEKGEFQIPDWVHPTLQDLISSMMCVNCEERLTISEAKEHPWMKQTQKNEPFVPLSQSPSAFAQKKKTIRCLIQ